MCQSQVVLVIGRKLNYEYEQCTQIIMCTRVPDCMVAITQVVELAVQFLCIVCFLPMTATKIRV